MKTIINDTKKPNSQLVKSVFARHETFHPRFGWLKKGFELAKQYPDLFLDEQAPIKLGVGKNMVSAIRYWSHAFKLLKDDKPLELGEKLLSNSGWDSFLEDPASLWLLHWNLLKPVCEATAWYFMFNIFTGIEFTADELLIELRKYKNTLGSNVVDSSLKKDINCILRMYAEVEAQTSPLEDSLNCPFTELGLIKTSKDSKVYTFSLGHKNNLPAAIIVATCLEYAATIGNEKTISIFRLLHDEGSPGRVFKLSEEALLSAIETVYRQFPQLTLSDAAGLIQLSFNQEPMTLAMEVLENYYCYSRKAYTVVVEEVAYRRSET